MDTSLSTSGNDDKRITQMIMSSILGSGNELKIYALWFSRRDK